jgi:hypothetical protein
MLRMGMAGVVGALLSGCGGIAPSEGGRPVPLGLVLDQLKCEVAMALHEIDPEKLNLTGWYIDGKLTAKIIVSSTLDASAGTPNLVPLGGDASGGFSFTGGVTRSSTSTAILDLFISSQAAGTQICDEIGNDPTKPSNLGVYAWIKSLTSARRGEPRIAFSNLSYTLEFGVKRSGKLGVDLVVIPLKLGASAAGSRDDVQTLLLTMNPGKAVQDAAKEVVAISGKPTPVSAGGGRVIVPFSASDNDTTLEKLPTQ